MIESVLNVSCNINEGTTLDELIDTLIDMKDELKKINVKPKLAFERQLIFTSYEEKKGK